MYGNYYYRHQCHDHPARISLTKQTQIMRQWSTLFFGYCWPVTGSIPVLKTIFIKIGLILQFAFIAAITALIARFKFFRLIGCTLFSVVI